jgi:hypothetical protein
MSKIEYYDTITSYGGNQDEKYIFLIFRVFNHDKNKVKGAEKLFLNTHEKWIKYKKVGKRKRAFCHVEMILPNRQWFGIINNSHAKNKGVFLKHKISYGNLKDVDLRRDINNYYPQVVQIKVDTEQTSKILKFANDHKGEAFGSWELMVNMATFHFLNFSILKKKKQWYCTKLMLECIKYAEIIKDSEIDSCTSNSEDIYEFCVNKAMKEDDKKKKGEKKQYWILPYKQFPKNMILGKK